MTRFNVQEQLQQVIHSFRIKDFPLFYVIHQIYSDHPQRRKKKKKKIYVHLHPDIKIKMEIIQEFIISKMVFHQVDKITIKLIVMFANYSNLFLDK